MYIVTGAAGFIGSNLVHALNRRGEEDILAVDRAGRIGNAPNLDAARLRDRLDADAFRARLRANAEIPGVRGVLHQGACTDTMETDRDYMLDANLAFSKELLDWCLARRLPFVYASSASVYGVETDSRERPENEKPINVYAESKLLFDQEVRRRGRFGSTVAGLRYFNVYGPREGEKGRMASMVYQLCRQLVRTGTARLFEGTEGYADGEQRRDFVHVDDAAAVNLFFLDGPPRQAIVNVGTGAARSFNDVARALIAALGRGGIEYIPFPETLRGKYQHFTEAELTALRAAGYAAPFLTLEEGVARSLPLWLAEAPKA